MLKVLRSQKTKKNIFIVLAIVIIPPFVLWGTMTGEGDEKMPTGALGRYQGKNISIQDYLKSYKASQHQMMLQFGEQYNQIGKFINLKGEAFDRILLLDHAKREKISASDKEVVTWIAQQQAFHGKNGFDDRYYKQFCENYLRVQPREFEEEIRQMLVLQKIGDGLSKEVPAPTDEELKKADEKLFETDKEKAKTHYLNQKVDEKLKALVEGLRKNLEINQATFDKLFPPDETPKIETTSPAVIPSANATPAPVAAPATTSSS